MRHLEGIIADNKKAQREWNARGRNPITGKVQPGRKGQEVKAKPATKRRPVEDVREGLQSIPHPAAQRLAKNLG